MAPSEIGCHSAMIARQVLKELADLPYNSSQQPGEELPKPVHPNVDAAPTPIRLSRLAGMDSLAPASWDGELVSNDVDYPANKGAKLDSANDADLETKRRFSTGHALEIFVKAEKRIQAKIEELMGKL
ncbi:hypothetical protein ASPVEDRAFT_621184 [Aspergillus versicolor CBS 583.65]|uniref:Uncharacterized protein n=1 Tax=Aspergillus versicolor CBS 583.65 TaxID=1036611 RepID=A0A1L9PIA4_ASPVE|nr:uncharacterized protein ASPVEDRAFT_621184 [Aspergillus versicolor CBS 583.65]OJJ01193.1 hypothetical protein ASPVEDRAFT_621184 [Aspergillus versicolor CBS 583.65]